jgi:hypothetical protein
MTPPLKLKRKENNVIRIKPDGSISYLHNDKITAALRNEGDLMMSRASNVSFSNKDKLWYIYLPDSNTKVLDIGFVDRESAIIAEIEVLQKFL